MPDVVVEESDMYDKSASVQTDPNIEIEFQSEISLEQPEC